MLVERDTKTALLDFAEHAARSRGFDGFSYADLSEAVGIKKASIHYHFPTKAILREALMDRYHVYVEERCHDIKTQSEVGAERLLGLIGFYREALGDGKILCLCVSLSASKDSLSKAVITKINTFRSMMVQWLAEVFKAAKDDHSIGNVSKPRDEAQATLALLEGAQLAARAEENVLVFDRAVAILKSRCEKSN